MATEGFEQAVSVTKGVLANVKADQLDDPTPCASWMGLATTDTLTHAWDLAKSTGQSTDLAPELAEQVLAVARQAISDAVRGDEPMPFAAEKNCPDGASAADRLAAFLGRTV